jgi:Tfp pilus assembly pilus retraction ATPase PilT
MSATNKIDQQLNRDSLLLDARLSKALGTRLSLEQFQEILAVGFKNNVSDLLLREGLPLMVKKNKRIVPIQINGGVLSKSAMECIVSYLSKSDASDRSLLNSINQGLKYNGLYLFEYRHEGERQKIRYRVNALLESGFTTPSIAMRLNDDELLSLSELGHSMDGDIYDAIFNSESGVSLITGETDSGKTTLIYALLNDFIVNDEQSSVINTYESPPEGNLMNSVKRRLSSGKPLNKFVSQVEVGKGKGCDTYQEALDESLRRNSDIILFGELRTGNEIQTALKTANITGGLVLGTMHTKSVSTSVDRILKTVTYNNSSELLAAIFEFISSTNFILSQRLIPTIKGGRVAIYEYLKLYDLNTKNILKRVADKNIALLPEAVDRLVSSESPYGGLAGMAKKHFDDGVISESTLNKILRSYATDNSKEKSNEHNSRRSAGK